MLPYEPIYRFNLGPDFSVPSKRESDVKPDLKEIAEEIARTHEGADAMSILAEYQRRMNAYMSEHGFVFYQP